MASGDKKKESFFEWAGLFALFIVMIVTLIWLFGSNRVVYGTAKPLYYLAHPWKWFGYKEEWDLVYKTAGTFYQYPGQVSFFDWAGFANLSMRPSAMLVMVIGLSVAIFLASSRKGGLKAKLKPDLLLKLVSSKFTGIIPVLAIRADLVANKNPLWRRITAPEDYIRTVVLPGTKRKLLTVPPGTRIEDARFTMDDAQTLLEGFVGTYMAHGNQYLVSNTLGRQVVNLLKDSELYERVCFPDRLSNEGKVIFALFCAQAFGGPEGKKDYAEYRDKLNRAAFGERNGMTNLSIAQPLYEKYRDNGLAKKLFAIHNWENTYLAELVRQAKRQGKVGHWEIMWLLPTNRALFFSIQNMGMKTPSVENAASFNHYMYERACARLHRLPLERVKHTDESGQESVILEPVVFVEGAIEGLLHDWKQWCENTDDAEDVWKHTEVWGQVNASVNKEFENIRQSISALQNIRPEGSQFDDDQTDQRRQAEMRTQAEFDAARRAQAGFETGFNT